MAKMDVARAAKKIREALESPTCRCATEGPELSRAKEQAERIWDGYHDEGARIWYRLLDGSILCGSRFGGTIRIGQDGPNAEEIAAVRDDPRYVSDGTRKSPPKRRIVYREDDGGRWG